MSDSYAATVLLRSDWSFDPAEFAEVLGERFPDIGQLSGRPDPDDAEAAILTVDGAELRIAPQPGAPAGLPGRDGRDPDGHLPQRATDPAPILSDTAHRFELTCGGYGADTDWTKAYATVVTLVAGALARLGPSPGVFLPASGAVLTPDEAYRAGRLAMGGVSPIEAWVLLYPYAPANRTGAPLSGAFTRGLAPFLGHELELAPSAVDSRTALTRLHGAVWQALDGGFAFADGALLGEPLSPGRMQVRRSDGWLRPGTAAYVLIGAESPVDGETLELRPPPPDMLPAPGRLPAIPDIGAVFERIDLSGEGVGRWLRSRAAPALSPMLRIGARRPSGPR